MTSTVDIFSLEVGFYAALEGVLMSMPFSVVHSCHSVDVQSLLRVQCLQAKAVIEKVLKTGGM